MLMMNRVKAEEFFGVIQLINEQAQRAYALWAGFLKGAVLVMEKERR